MCLYLVCYFFFEGEGKVEEFLVVDVFLLGFEVEDVQAVHVFELQAATYVHRKIEYRTNTKEANLIKNKFRNYLLYLDTCLCGVFPLDGLR